MEHKHAFMYMSNNCVSDQIIKMSNHHESWYRATKTQTSIAYEHQINLHVKNTFTEFATYSYYHNAPKMAASYPNSIPTHWDMMEFKPHWLTKKSHHLNCMLVLFLHVLFMKSALENQFIHKLFPDSSDCTHESNKTQVFSQVKGNKVTCHLWKTLIGCLMDLWCCTSVLMPPLQKKLKWLKSFSLVN